MDQVTTDAGFSHKKPLYSFKKLPSSSSDEKPSAPETENDNVDTGLRRIKQTKKNSERVPVRRARHSAPDLSFGGRVDMSLLEVRRLGNVMDFKEKPLKYPVRRASLGTELEHIEEEEGGNDGEGDEALLNRLSLSERLLAQPLRLPPIFENQGYKPQRRDFTQKATDGSHIDVTDAVQLRYVRNGPDNRRRKMSM
ncbi:uncharacterized protein [Watersipora subatra]|uniref:uncharacterized protein n=1 Tax=Watersipora subatra TaxID=2589382 RepID=UPI00355C1F23